MGVDLGGGDVGMAQQFLDDPQVGPPSSRWVAKAWRRTWGLTRAGSIPASAAASSSIWAKRRGVRRPALPREGNSQGLAASPLGRKDLRISR